MGVTLQIMRPLFPHLPAKKNASDLTRPLVGNESTASVFRSLLVGLHDRGNKVGSSKAHIIYRKEKNLVQVVPKGSPNGAQCTVKDKHGIPGDSQERVEVVGGWGGGAPLNPKTR